MESSSKPLYDTLDIVVDRGRRRLRLSPIVLSVCFLLLGKDLLFRPLYSLPSLGY
jgi:hypothetical protein